MYCVKCIGYILMFSTFKLGFNKEQHVFLSACHTSTQAEDRCAA